MVVVLVAAVWAIWFSPLLAVRTVSVSGLATLTSDQVMAVADVPIGRPLARLDTAAIVQRVETLPAVARAEVIRHLDGRVELRVTERTAILVAAVDGAYQLVDGQGVAYQTLDSPPAELPLVSLTGTDQARLMADAAVIVTALPPAILDQTAAIAATSPDSFTIALRSGATIMWGSADQSSLKAEVMVALIQTPASYYDVSSPSHPATR